MIEIHYARDSSTKPPRITGEDIVPNPLEFPEPLLSTRQPDLRLNSRHILLEIENIRCSSESTEFSSTFVEAEADPETLVTKSEFQSPAIPEPTEENVFLADLGGETDEYEVRDY